MTSVIFIILPLYAVITFGGNLAQTRVSQVLAEVGSNQVEDIVSTLINVNKSNSRESRLGYQTIISAASHHQQSKKARSEVKMTLLRLFGYVLTTGADLSHQNKQLTQAFLKAVMGYENERATQFASALLVGKKNLSESDRYKIKTMGLQHLFVLSGTHLSTVVLVMASMLSKYSSRKNLLILSSMLLVWYVSILDSVGVSMMRAAGMTTLLLLARLRLESAPAAYRLLLVGSSLIIVDPEVITSISFQLSFTATASIIFIFPLLGRWWKQVWSWLNIKYPSSSRFSAFEQALQISIAVQLGITPLLVFHFEEVAPWGIIFSVVFFPIIMLLLTLLLIGLMVYSGLSLLPVPTELIEMLLALWREVLAFVFDLFFFIFDFFSQFGLVINLPPEGVTPILFATSLISIGMFIRGGQCHYGQRQVQFV